jgi:hypothetical protein
MKRLLSAPSSLVLAFLLAPACATPPAPIPEGSAVLIKESHHHTKYCGHYRFGDQWYFIYQHRHGVNCGHELVNGEWILPRE